jgi:hypothetical protein
LGRSAISRHDQIFYGGDPKTRRGGDGALHQLPLKSGLGRLDLEHELVVGSHEAHEIRARGQRRAVLAGHTESGAQQGASQTLHLVRRERGGEIDIGGEAWSSHTLTAWAPISA